MAILISTDTVDELKRALQSHDRHRFNQIICRILKITHYTVDEQLFEDWQTAADILTNSEFAEEIRKALENLKYSR